MERRNITDSPMEIYIHIPFCIKKCDYCDILSGPSGPKEQAEYVDALLEEILNHIRRKFQIADYAEITIEVNPGTADRNKLQAYRTYGINRLSIGLQSPDDRELKILGRIHNYEQFLETYRSAREAGFDNINIDLMSAIPDQTYEGWIHNLRTVAGLDPEHISAYSLIIEEGTPFASRTLNLPDEDAEYNMYEATAQILREYGFEQYEISNYAKKGRECRHNVGYWIRQDYLGFGLGASSLYGKERFANTQDMKKYLETSRPPENIREKEPPLTREDEMAEFMFLGLRMMAGVSEQEFYQRFGISMMEVYGDIIKKYQNMDLLCRRDTGRVALTEKGIDVSNSILSDFLLNKKTADIGQRNRKTWSISDNDMPHVFIMQCIRLIKRSGSTVKYCFLLQCISVLL